MKPIVTMVVSNTNCPSVIAFSITSRLLKISVIPTRQMKMVIAPPNSPTFIVFQRKFSFFMACTLLGFLLCQAFTQDALWTEQQDHNEHGICNYIFELIRSSNTQSLKEEGRSDGLKNAEYEASYHGSWNIPDPSQHGGRKCLDAGGKSHQEENLAEYECIKHARRTRHGCANGKRGHNNSIDVDAHQGCGILILR